MALSHHSPTEDLFNALQAGDREALRALLPPLRERLQALAKQRLSEPLAEDMVQETLTTLWERRDALGGADHVLPFVFQTLRNKIGNVYLRAKRRSEIAGNPGPGGHELLHPARHPQAIVEGREFERTVGRAIGRCAAEHEQWGAVLTMLKQGRTVAEIRESFGDTPMATVHTRIFRARQRLKQILREDYDIDLQEGP